MESTNIISIVMEAFLDVMTGIVALFAPVQELFWTSAGPTWLGSMSLIGVGIAVVLLVTNIVRSFLHLR